MAPVRGAQTPGLPTNDLIDLAANNADTTTHSHSYQTIHLPGRISVHCVVNGHSFGSAGVG